MAKPDLHALIKQYRAALLEVGADVVFSMKYSLPPNVVAYEQLNLARLALKAALPHFSDEQVTAAMMAVGFLS